ncbi:MAG: anti-sigma factor domain-containing protein [Clostridiales bacterium]|nr:anti-sigma factor domain-containing protein [Clostridiales bacterium]
MKQGLVTKIEKKFIIVKTDDADIERLKKRTNIQVGERISYERKDIYKGFNKISYNQIGASLSMIIILAVVGFNILNQINQNEVFAVVSYDVNPGFILEINNDDKVLTISSTDGFDHIIPVDYKKQALDGVLNDITDNVIKEHLLIEYDIILLSYVNVSDKPKDSEALHNFINSKKNNYQIVLVTSEETYLEKANDNNQSVGRHYISELLEVNNIPVEESNQYIQEAVKALDIIDEDTNDVIELDTTTLIEKDTSKIESGDDQTAAADTKTEENSSSETTDQTKEESADTSEDEKKEDDDKQSEEDLKAIEKQKTITDEAHQDYLNKKSASETAKRNLDQQQSLVNEKTEQLETQQSRYSDILNGETELVDEKNTLNNRINVEKANLINEALLIRDTTINSTESDQNKVDQLKAEADRIYDVAYNIYRPIADNTITYLEQLKNDKQELLNNPPTTMGINTDGIQAEVDELVQMINDIDNQSSILIPEVTADSVNQEMIYTYNAAYAEFNLKREEKHALYNQANKLQKEIDSIEDDANTLYNNRLKEIDDLYSGDLTRIEEIQSVLDGFKNIKPKFETNIQEMSDELVLLNNELARLSNLYKQAIRSRDDAYSIYLKEKEILDQLENKE